MSEWVAETKVVASILVPTAEALARRGPRPARRHVPLDSEVSMYRRFSPARSRWPDIDTFDDRANELVQRALALNEELAGLEERRKNALQADREALAAWQLAGGKGRRPEPTLPAIEAEIEQKTADRDAALAAQEKVFEEKQQFVEKQRRRLVREADGATRKAHERYREAIDLLEQARAELTECRAASLWASLFPGPLATSSPPVHALAVGLRKPVEAALGVPNQIGAAAILQVLRTDADLLAEAMTREQALDLGAAQPEDLGAAVWQGTPEGQAQLRKERQEALERYREMWGSYPA